MMFYFNCCRRRRRRCCCISNYSAYIFSSLVFQLVAMIDKKVNGVNSFSGPYWLSNSV